MTPSPPPRSSIPQCPGPSLAYTSTGNERALVTQVDRIAVEDPRERAICRALLIHALALLDRAESTPDHEHLHKPVRPQDPS